MQTLVELHGDEEIHYGKLLGVLENVLFYLENKM